MSMDAWDDVDDPCERCDGEGFLNDLAEDDDCPDGPVVICPECGGEG